MKFNRMKKIIRKALPPSVFLLVLLVGFSVAALLIEPLGDIVFSIVFGSCYRGEGEISVRIGEKEEQLSVYRKKGKPFLLIGPGHFGNEDSDFFFVNREQVIRTATDKGGDAWVRVGNYLFIPDDLSNTMRLLRAPYWDDLKCDEESTVTCDGTAKVYRYSFRINNLTLPVSFSLPAEFLDDEMRSTSNVTREDRPAVDISDLPRYIENERRTGK